MGTNYYLEARPPCESCGRSFESEHIGKASAGWKFSWQATDSIRSVQDWKEHVARTENAKIVDEYGKEHDVETFFANALAREGRLHAELYTDANFISPEGESFSEYEFS